MTLGTSTVARIDCAAFFESEGLPMPPLPDDLIRVMQETERGAFSTSNWRGGAPGRFAASAWLDAGTGESEAWCGLAGRGFHSTTLQVGLASPRCGIFIRKLVPQAFDDAEIHRRRVQGSFDLMRYLCHAMDAAHAWPSRQRLVIVDDDNEFLRWGWVAEQGAQWSDLTPDTAGWISALMSVESLAGLPT